MAKTKADKAPDGPPPDGPPPDGITPADPAGAGAGAGTDLADDGDEAAFDHPLAGDPALADAKSAADEIQRLREEVAALRAGAAGAFEPGRRYLVRVKDAVAWVVAPAAGEHPFDAYKRATGVLNSVHAPEIHPTELPVGRAAA